MSKVKTYEEFDASMLVVKYENKVVYKNRKYQVTFYFDRDDYSIAAWNSVRNSFKVGSWSDRIFVTRYLQRFINEKMEELDWNKNESTR